MTKNDKMTKKERFLCYGSKNFVDKFSVKLYRFGHYFVILSFFVIAVIIQ